MNYEDCKFEDAINDLLWCDAPETGDCTLKQGTESNKCRGYCSIQAGIPCYTTEYNICVLPANP